MFFPRQQVGHKGNSEEPWVHPESELLQGTERNHCEVLEESKDQREGQVRAGQLEDPELGLIPQNCEGRGPRSQEGGLT